MKYFIVGIRKKYKFILLFISEYFLAKVKPSVRRFHHINGCDINLVTLKTKVNFIGTTKFKRNDLSICKHKELFLSYVNACQNKNEYKLNIILKNALYTLVNNEKINP